jgi:hypothetical protein
VGETRWDHANNPSGASALSPAARRATVGVPAALCQQGMFFGLCWLAEARSSFGGSSTEHFVDQACTGTATGLSIRLRRAPAFDRGIGR